MTPGALEHLLGLARRDLPPGLAFGTADPCALIDDLWPAEAAAMTRAVPKRRREFAAGRRAARLALSGIGAAPTAIPMNPDRSPDWPPGITASLSHTGDACLALVGRSENWVGIGIDLEGDDPLDPALVPEICSDAELAHHALPPAAAARRIFSAKEAAYKAQYPVSRSLLEFSDLRIQPLTGGAFAARFTRDVPSFAKGQALSGRLYCARGLVLSIVLLPA